MDKFNICLAEKSDDEEIRQLLINNPVPGNISLIYQKEPSYFTAISVGNRQTKTIIIKDAKKIIAVQTIGIREVYFNSQIIKVGYLSNLRLAKEYQGQKILKAGFNFLKKINQDIAVPFYFSTIIAENKKVLQNLSRQREEGLKFIDYGNYHTKAIILNKKQKNITTSYQIIQASQDRLDAITNFMNEQGSKKNFYPYYTRNDWQDKIFLKDFKIENFYLALENNKIVGIVGLWDQNNFKQNVVASYHGILKYYKLYNMIKQLWQQKKLPTLGQKLNFAYLSFIAIQNNNPEIFTQLLKHIYNEQNQTNYLYLMLGLHENDPLLHSLQEFKCLTYKSKLFINYWEKPDILKKEAVAIPYLEIASL